MSKALFECSDLILHSLSGLAPWGHEHMMSALKGRGGLARTWPMEGRFRGFGADKGGQKSRKFKTSFVSHPLCRDPTNLFGTTQILAAMRMGEGIQQTGVRARAVGWSNEIEKRRLRQIIKLDIRGCSSLRMSAWFFLFISSLFNATRGQWPCGPSMRGRRWPKLS